MPFAQKVAGSKIRAARHGKGWTQAELARAIGTRERNIIRWENNQNAPRSEWVAAIAAATDQDIAFFFDAADEDEEESDPMGRVPDLLRDLAMAFETYKTRSVA